jgi:hypothetical protein
VLVPCAGAGLGCGERERAHDDQPQTPVEKPADDLRPTDAGLYRVGLRPRVEPAPVGPLHEWVLTVRDSSGGPFTPLRIAIDGGMPQHGHGFMTAPRVTGPLGPDEYLIEGMRFHMAGEWVIRVELVGERGADVATFKVQVGP